MNFNDLDKSKEYEGYFSGYGDSGSFDQVDSEELELLMYTILENHYSGWENNEGAHGSVRIFYEDNHWRYSIDIHFPVESYNHAHTLGVLPNE